MANKSRFRVAAATAGTVVTKSSILAAFREPDEDDTIDEILQAVNSLSVRFAGLSQEEIV